MNLSLLVRSILTVLLAAISVSACDVETFEDGVDQFNGGTPTLPPPPGSPPPPPPPPPPGGFGPNFSEIQTNVFTPSCASSSCHGGAAPDANLNLEAGSSYAELVGIASEQNAGLMLVAANDPDNSYLIQKMENAAGIVGDVMPPAGPIAQSSIDTIRQWITQGAIDDGAAASTPIRVSSMSPLPGISLPAAPTEIVVGFDRDPDASTVNGITFTLQSSGGDGTFTDGNELLVTAGGTGITVPVANPRTAMFDLSGVALADDTYRVTLLGTGASLVMDLDSNALDGEFIANFPSGNGTAGGDFTADFSIATPIMIGPTLDQIQAVVFTPNCATVGCHAGALPAGGLLLTDADTSLLQLVGVPSSGQAGAIRVVANDPVNSYLIQKLENAAGIAGTMMPPPGRPALDPTFVPEIRNWILNGALR